MSYQIIPFIGGPLGGQDYWADTDKLLVKFSHSFNWQKYTEPHEFRYLIKKNPNGVYLAVCGKPCKCTICYQREREIKEAKRHAANP